MKEKKCYLKAHSGTTGFAACQVCIKQDICETNYMLSESDESHQSGEKTNE